MHLDGPTLFLWLFVMGLSVPSILLLRIGSRLALVPLLVSLGVAGFWALYELSGWFSNPGVGAAAPFALAVLVGWLIVAAESIRWGRRRRNKRALH